MDGDIAVQYLRQKVENNKLTFSKHARKRMGERKIKYNDVEKAIIEGEPIERQEFGEDVKVLFQEATDNIPECYVVVATAYPTPVVVTVCRTKDEAWECWNGILRRTKKGE